MFNGTFKTKKSIFVIIMKKLSFSYRMILVTLRIHEACVCYNRKRPKMKKIVVPITRYKIAL